MVKKRAGKGKPTGKPAAPTRVRARKGPPVAVDQAEAYLHPEGTLTVLSLDPGAEFRMGPRQRNAIAEAAEAIEAMLRDGYTLLVEDREGAHVRVQRFDKKRRVYVVSGSGGTSVEVPIARARALALPRQAGG
jgi:hypothetical protein